MEWFGGFFEWLWCLFKELIDLVLSVLAEIWYYTIGFIIRLLPVSPFEFEPVSWGEFGKMVGYFLPIPTIAAHFTALLIAILTYYAIRHVLRLVKMVK